MSYTHSKEDSAPTQAGHREDVSHIEPDDIGVAMLTVLFAFVAVVVLLVVVLLQAWFYNWKVELLAQRSGPIDVQETPAAIAQKQLQRIETYGWTDRKTQARAIRIERAMELVAADLAPEASAKEASGK
ncbi:MAG: hypothetical protein ACLP9L_36130 [Thermoguttaceae bacterium]